MRLTQSEHARILHPSILFLRPNSCIVYRKAATEVRYRYPDDSVHYVHIFDGKISSDLPLIHTIGSFYTLLDPLLATRNMVYSREVFRGRVIYIRVKVKFDKFQRGKYTKDIW